MPLKKAILKHIIGAALKNVPFFASIPNDALEFLYGSLHVRLYLDGDHIVTAGELGSEFFLIESGTVMITSGDGKDIIAALSKGDYFGESCLLTLAPRTASAVSHGYSSLYILDNVTFREVFISLHIKHYLMLPQFN